jgi:hypothetical protein
MSNLTEIRPVGTTLMHANRRTDGQTQTDGHNKGFVREYSNAPQWITQHKIAVDEYTNST